MTGIFIKRERKYSDVTTAPDDTHAATRAQMLLGGRVAMLFALSQPYLLLPFATLAMAATVAQSPLPLWLTVPPFIGQLVMLVVGMRLKDAYNRRSEDDPHLWARRYTFLSGMSGAVWGLAAMVWFVPGAYSAQAYLVLAYLGMTATEFVSRAAYRPAFLAHSAMSLIPLAALLANEGNAYQILTAVLILCFAGVLSTYSGTIARYFDEMVILRNENAKLILRLSQEKRDAESARDSARASDRAKSSFISNISHEIRTPLNAILGMAQLLERSEMEKAQRNHVKVLLEAGRGLKTLLDDIIALAQTDDELGAGVPEEGSDAAQAARTVARLLQPNAWEKRLRLSVNVAASLPRVAADARILRRVLLKLASNAIKFTERGSIEIALDTVHEDGKALVRFRVTDTGTGIPAHILGNIFEAFAKGDDSYSRRYNGAGVGLAVAKRLTESMGGAIGVESDPGAGATFWLTVPAAQGGMSDVSGLAEDVPPPGGLAILAWLEDTATRAMLDHMLTPFGNRITFAASLAEAAAQSARGGFAIVIAAAPAVDALAVAPGQRTPILALAGSDARTPDGADGVLRWPAPPGALYSAIAAIMDGSSVKGSTASAEDIAGATIDAKVFGELEKSLGLKTLVDILQSYLGTAEQLSSALEGAIDTEDWPAAGRIAQDIAGAAGGLGLSALTGVARTLALGVRDDAAEALLKQAATGIFAEHKRARDALKKLYPDLAA